MAPDVRRKDAPRHTKAPLGLHQLAGGALDEDDTSGARWFETFPAWPTPATGGLRASQDEWKSVAGEALSSMSKMYEKKSGQRGKTDIQKVLQREQTIGDKIAAATLVVQECPLYRLDELYTLFSFVKKKGRRERSPAIDALKDLLINDLLPDDRRLVRFSDRNFECGANSVSKRHLSYALFEDEIKSLYAEFLQILDECGKDSVSHFKVKSVRAVFDLLVAKPENEKELLSMLVNKLGDPERKVASNASYYLRLLVEKHHPQMKLILVQELEQLLHRKNVGRRTQYYAVSLLNQFRFTAVDVELSRRLVALYMSLVSLFVDNDKDRKNVKKEGGLESKESRIMGALLTGVNRAFPYTEPEKYDAGLDSQYDALFRIAHAKSISSATQALSVLLHVSKSNATLSDRFYRALYSRIEDLASTGDSKQALLLNLVFKSMKADDSSRRVRAFSKRLLQTALKGSSGLSGSALVLLSEVLAVKHPGMLKAATTVPEGDDGEENFKDVVSESEAEPDADGDNSDEETATATETGKASETDPGNYNISAREPLHARAERSSLWELSALASHFHPSVSKFSHEMCVEQKSITYPSDPLTDFTLMSFLEKFSYKKPKRKTSESLHGKRAERASRAMVSKSDKFFDAVRDGEEGEEDAFFGKFFEINPMKLEALTGNAGIAQVDLKGVEDSDSEGEEEAFEKAMHEEMRRLGGGMEFVNDEGDVDSENSDEVTAFADAFRDEMAKEDGGDEGGDGGLEEGDGSRDDGIFEVEAIEQEDSRKARGKRNASSVFAAADDYAEEIENDLRRAEASDSSAEAEANESSKGSGRARKRKRKARS